MPWIFKMKIEFCLRLIFLILIIYKPSWGHVRSHTQFWPDRCIRFDVYWILTDSYKQTQTSKVFIYRDKLFLKIWILTVVFFKLQGGTEFLPYTVIFVSLYLCNITLSVFKDMGIGKFEFVGRTRFHIKNYFVIKDDSIFGHDCSERGGSQTCTYI